MRQELKENAAYFIALLYSLMPILSSYGHEYFIFTLLATIIFDVVYISIIFIYQKWWEYLVWLYLAAYIVCFSWYNLNIAMFFLYQSNLLTYRFKDKPWYSFYWCVIYLEFVLIYGRALLVNTPIFDLIFLAIMHAFAFGLMLILTGYRKKAEMEELLHEKNQSINLLLAENERQRIGQDLHDSLGHVFAMLSVKSELALTLLNNQAYDKAKKEIEELNQITKTSMHEVRQIVENLKSHTLAEEIAIIENMLGLADVSITVSGLDRLEGLTSTQENTLAMSLRELTNNLLKHSDAKHCQINFEKTEQEIVLLFEDDGKGFSELTGQELHTLKDRMIYQQGSVEIVSLKEPTQIKLTMKKEVL